MPFFYINRPRLRGASLNTPPPPGIILRVMLCSTMMMLSLAFAANIGGTGTLIGTSPNLVFYGVIRDKCPGQPIKKVSFKVVMEKKICMQSYHLFV